MSSKFRLVGAAVFAVAPVMMLAGCGADATGAQTTLVPLDTEATNYVALEPATTTTTTTVPEGTGVAGGTSEGEQIHTVQSGDSLSKIASIYNVSMDDIIKYNGWTDGLNHFLGIGDEIPIPPGASIPGASPAASGDTSSGDTSSGDTSSETTAPSTSGDCATSQYTITAEDTSRIKVASRFDITYQELDAANVNTPGYSSFVVGTVIVIPCP